MVDWDLAVTTARRLMRPGPDIGRDEAAHAVADLRRYAAQAEGHVRSYTLLDTESATAPVVVVDRAGWVQANVDGLRLVIDPLVEKMRASRSDPSSFATAIGSRVTGLEAGGLFAFLSNKVLGQFDPFFTGFADPRGHSTHDADGADVGVRRTTHGGRLLLVAPNVVQVERELNVDPDDFRLWVCLHEETHRVQFTAVPWLRSHLLSEIETLLDKTDLDPGRLAQMLRDGIERVGRLVRGDSDVSLLDIVQTPEQRAVIERLTAVMSLLEGHADVVMDGVGPEVVTSVEHIRTVFNERRAGAGPLDQMIRKLLGFDAKLRQYREGAVFVRGVLDKVEMVGFNAVWAEPANLPTKDEITDPARWVTRVHG
ncbi:MAG: zinc-dependent metalloprotease [Actinomycetota bacterium]|nr:zinc-dependent metalloprotease [Actinomycetota bacterium]